MGWGPGPAPKKYPRPEHCTPNGPPSRSRHPPRIRSHHQPRRGGYNLLGLDYPTQRGPTLWHQCLGTPTARTEAQRKSMTMAPTLGDGQRPPGQH